MAIQQNYPAISPSLSLDFANVKALDPRITFSRASTATYYGTETAKAEENLLLRSQEFDNAGWGKFVSATVTANTAVAPDGTTTADTLSLSASANSRIEQTVPTISGAQYTYSVFMRVASGTLSVRLYGIDGTLGTAFTVTDVWQRFTVTATASSATRFPAIATDGVAGDVFIWGAQLEQRSAVTAYTPTTTQPITNYIPVLESEASGVARFNHNPTTFESLGLLIEEQRTNLLLRSEEFDNAAWTKNNSTVMANQVIAPDGTLTGDKLVENTATTSHTANLTVSGASNIAYTLSCYFKAAERGFAYVRLSDGVSGNAYGFVNLTTLATGTTGSAVWTGVSVSAASVGNGWVRLSVTATRNNTASVVLAYVGVAPDISTISYTGDGYSGIFIWGAQLEVGAFATSYIPTSASQVTRAADAASMIGANFSSWYNAAEGSFFASMDYMSATTTTWVLAAHSGLAATTNDYLAFVKNATAFHRQSIVASGVSQGNLDIAGAVVGVVYKYAGCYKVNDAAFTVDGATPLTDNTVNLPVPNAFQLGNLFNQYLNGHIRKISYYPVRVTNEQLQGLTS